MQQLQQQNPMMMTIRYVEESRVSITPEVRFNEWYTPVELLDEVPEVPFASDGHRIAGAPWFNNFGSSSALLEHMRPTTRANAAPTQYNSAAARFAPVDSRFSFESIDTTHTNSSGSVFEDFLVRAKRASESLTSSLRNSLKGKRNNGVKRVNKFTTACFCGMPEPVSHRV